MLVKDLFGVDEEEIEEKAENEERGDFWTNSLSFYNQVKDRDIQTLSKKQTNWLEKIDDLIQQEENNGD